MKRFFLLIALGAALIVAGCGESQRPQATGKASIRAINAMKGLPAVLFFIEERGLGTLDYKESSGLNRYDDLSYVFNFETVLPGEIETTRASHWMSSRTGTMFSSSADLSTPRR